MSGLNSILKNRFYVGEIYYREMIYTGDHEPILDRELFDAVQAQLARNNVAKNLIVRGRPAILSGKIYDDNGNRMLSTHTNKNGVRYRYYASTATLQRQKAEAGSIARVSAPDIETLVLQELRKRFTKAVTGDVPADNARDLIEVHVDRIVVARHWIEITLSDRSSNPQGRGTKEQAGRVIQVLWTPPSFVALKGELHVPSGHLQLKAETRDALIRAIAKALSWMQELIDGKTPSFKEIAAREGKCERHIRLLAPLAYVAPTTVLSIINQTAPASMTVTGLAKTLKLQWPRNGEAVSPA